MEVPRSGPSLQHDLVSLESPEVEAPPGCSFLAVAAPDSGEAAEMQTVERIRVLLVDDQTLYLEALAACLKNRPHLEIAGLCRSMVEVAEHLTSKSVDVVLVSSSVARDPNSHLPLQSLNGGFRGVVLLLVDRFGAEEAVHTVRFGAVGLVSRRSPVDMLIENICRAAAGRHCLPPPAALDPVHRPATPAPNSTVQRTTKPKLLTDRERAVLQGVSQGLANREIGKRMQVAEGTVKAFVHRIFLKTGARSRTQLINLALQHYAREL